MNPWPLCSSQGFFVSLLWGSGKYEQSGRLQFNGQARDEVRFCDHAGLSSKFVAVAGTASHCFFASAMANSAADKASLVRALDQCLDQTLGLHWLFGCSARLNPKPLDPKP